MTVTESVIEHEASAALVYIAAFGLPGAPDPPPLQLSTTGWAELLREARRHGLTGLLHWAVLTRRLTGTDEQISAAVEAHLPAAAQTARLEQELAAVSGILTEEGIPYRVLKGPAVARLDYPDPEMRTFVDLDVLVPGAAMTAAIRALGMLDYRRRTPAMRETYDRRFAKSVTVVSDRGLEVDLHRTLVDGPAAALIPLDDLWADAQRISVGAAQVDTLGQEQRLLHAAYTVAIANRKTRLNSLRDLAEILLSPSVDPVGLLHRVERWDAVPVLARAVGMTWSGLGLDDGLLGWWTQHTGSPPSKPRPPSGRWARWFDLYGTGDQPFPVLAAETLRLLPPSDRAVFLATVAYPHRAYLRSRGMGRLAYLKRGTSRLALRG